MNHWTTIDEDQSINKLLKDINDCLITRGNIVFNTINSKSYLYGMCASFYFVTEVKLNDEGEFTVCDSLVEPLPMNSDGEVLHEKKFTDFALVSMENLLYVIGGSLSASKVFFFSFLFIFVIYILIFYCIFVCFIQVGSILMYKYFFKCMLFFVTCAGMNLIFFLLNIKAT